MNFQTHSSRPEASLTCRLCGQIGVAKETFLQREYARCEACGSISLMRLPSVSQLREYYADFNDRYNAGMADRFEVEMPKRHAAKLKVVRTHIKSGQLLDVGCGEGWFLALASAAGFDAIGCDFGLRSSYPEGVRVLQGQLDAAGGLPFPDHSFDIVTFWAVIEHVRDPAAALAEIRRVLKPSGFLFCETPLVGDFCERMGAHVPPWLQAPEHVHVFSRRALGKSVSQAGFKTLRHYSFYERDALRWWARRLRNIAFAGLAGYLIRLLQPRAWAQRRESKLHHMGDIQLVIARAQPTS